MATRAPNVTTILLRAIRKAATFVNDTDVTISFLHDLAEAGYTVGRRKGPRSTALPGRPGNKMAPFTVLQGRPRKARHAA